GRPAARGRSGRAARNEASGRPPAQRLRPDEESSGEPAPRASKVAAVTDASVSSTPGRPSAQALGRYLPFERDEWADLRAATPMTLRAPDLARLQGINDHIDLDEVAA